MSETFENGLLCMSNDCTNVGSGSVAEVHEDVGVNVRDLRITNAETLESALIDESAGADAIDLLEDGARAGMHG